jgi:RNA polymerase sigma-70 factor (ECF subfamily)
MTDTGMNGEAGQQWVEKARTGDEEAFGELVRLYHERVYAVIYNVVHHAEDARDLEQQTWIKAWRHLDRFHGRSSFYTWLYRIATFTCLDFLRRRKSRPESTAEDETVFERAAEGAGAPAARPPDGDLARAELRERFAQALATLSPEHRLALVLREVEGLSYAQMAEAMQCRKGTVMSRLFHARRRVQEQLKDLA